MKLWQPIPQIKKIYKYQNPISWKIWTWVELNDSLSNINISHEDIYQTITSWEIYN